MALPIFGASYELAHDVNKDIVDTIEHTIHEKIDDIRADRWKPLCIVLSEKAYLALCYVIAKTGRHLRSGVMVDIEYYMDIMVVLDTTVSDDVRILRRPYEELAYPMNEKVENNDND